MFLACDWVIGKAAILRVTIGNDTVPNMMRKLAAVGAEVKEIERLYALEREVRGKNSHAGMHGPAVKLFTLRVLKILFCRALPLSCQTS